MNESSKVTIKYTDYRGLCFIFTGGIYFRKKEKREERNFFQDI